MHESVTSELIRAGENNFETDDAEMHGHSFLIFLEFKSNNTYSQKRNR